MKKLLKSTSILYAMGLGLTLAVTSVSAKDFSGAVIEAKFLGGVTYDPLYSRIPEWEKKTGATVKIISKKAHFEIDKEMKSDIASGATGWCVGSNHSSFAPQYTRLFQDMSKLLPEGTLDGFNPSMIESSTINGNLQMLPRATFDVSVLYYQKSLYADADNKAKFKAQYGYELSPPDTLNEWKDQAIFFSNPPTMYGTQYAGKEEAIVGRFYEILVAEGGAYMDAKGRPKFNSEAGQRALQWFKDLYEAGAVPKGTLSYLWDDLGAGMTSGTIAINLDWPGWAGPFNDPKSSKVAGNLGVKVQPKGSSGKRTGWSGFHGFSVTKDCPYPEAAADLVAFLTNEESQIFETEGGALPTRTAVWDVMKANTTDPFRMEALEAFAEGSKHAFAVPKFPEWVETTNILYPKLQAAILGDMTVKQALDKAAKEVTELMEDNGYF